MLLLHKRKEELSATSAAAAESGACFDQQQDEALRSCLEQQVKWFGEISEVMVKLDPPADVWIDTLDKLKRDLDQIREKCSSSSSAHASNNCENEQ